MTKAKQSSTLIAICPDIKDNAIWRSAATPLAIHSIGRQLYTCEPIPQHDLLSLNKLAAEGQMSEMKTILGWVINTRSLKILLPSAKFISWSRDTQSLIKCQQATTKQIETLEGRLNHIGNNIPQMWHFLNHFWHLKMRAEGSKNGRVLMIDTVGDDLFLCLDFLTYAHTGISINIVYRKPAHVYHSDASEHGIGGFSLTSSWVWHFKIPLNCHLHVSLNTLEFLGAVISLWIDIHTSDINPESCLLSQTDSMSAAGWIRKSCLNETQQLTQMHMAHHLAQLIIEARCCLYSQLFPADENNLAGSLSRDFHLHNCKLTSLLFSSIPEQIPPAFNIQPLPSMIYLWLISLLQMQPETNQSPKQPQWGKLMHAIGGSNTSHPLVFTVTPSLMNSPEDSAIGSSVVLHKQHDQGASLQKDLPWSNPDQSTPPWNMWHQDDIEMSDIENEEELKAEQDEFKQFLFSNRGPADQPRL